MSRRYELFGVGYELRDWVIVVLRLDVVIYPSSFSASVNFSRFEESFGNSFGEIASCHVMDPIISSWDKERRAQRVK